MLSLQPELTFYATRVDHCRIQARRLAKLPLSPEWAWPAMQGVTTHTGGTPVYLDLTQPIFLFVTKEQA